MVKIVELDFERGHAKVVVNNKLDLWHLEKIVGSGDFVSAKSPRYIFIRREDRKEKSKKKVVKLKIVVEKVEFSKNRDKLRIKGKVVDCPKDVPKGYHTIEVGLGSMIEIDKKWTEEQIKRLERAKQRIETSGLKLIEEFFVHLKKDDGLAVYGMDAVRSAANIGAVKIVLIPEEKIKDVQIEEIIKEVESKKGEIRLVSYRGKIEKDFCKNYGIGAILRFRIW